MAGDAMAGRQAGDRLRAIDGRGNGIPAACSLQTAGIGIPAACKSCQIRQKWAIKR